MITELHIRNFKGISRLDVDGLGRINLFVGKNDSCKSTILEAVHTTIRESIVPALKGSLARRTDMQFAPRELWYNYDTKQGIKIDVLFGKATVSNAISYGADNKQVSSVVELTFPRRAIPRTRRETVYSEGFSVSTSSAVHPFLVLSKENVVDKDFASNSEHIDSSSRNSVKYIESLLGRLKLESLDLDFGKFLSEVFQTEPKWEFMPHPDFPTEYRVALTKGGSRVFLNGFGDGIRFCILLVATCMLSKNTVLFIEEIESNQHPASLQKIIHFLVSISKKNNLQLFITTHSHHAMRRFLEESEDKSETDRQLLQLYRVKREIETGVVECERRTTENEAEFDTELDKDLCVWRVASSE